VTVKSSVALERLSDVKSVSIHIDGVGFLCLPIVALDLSGDHVALRFDILSREQSVALKEAIKSHFFFVKREDVLSPLQLSDPKSSTSEERAASRYEAIS
jgi:hypothetical protein